MNLPPPTAGHQQAGAAGGGHGACNADPFFHLKRAPAHPPTHPQGISKQALQTEDMEHIVSTLEFDGLIEEMQVEEGEPKRFRQVRFVQFLVAVGIIFKKCPGC